MTYLKEIGEYVQTTAEVISSILDMQVIICDTDLELVGDSYPDFSPKDSRISHESILTEVMELGKNVVLDSNESHQGCAKCANREKCNVISIVGMPIIYEDNIIGSIGILAESQNSKEILLSKKEYYMGFISKMSDLLISKVRERKKNIELKILRKRLLSIVDSIDGALISSDGSGHIIHWNTNIKDFFNISDLKGKKIHLYDIIQHPSIRELVEKGIEFKNKEIVFNRDGKTTYALISGKTIDLDDYKYGAVIVLKKLTDVYDEVNDLSNNRITTNFNQIVGSSKQINIIKNKAQMVSNSKSTVLIQGESGTGKEVFARAIHYTSKLKDKPFIAINCAAIPDNLLESELFGYDEGAFSGAKKGGKIGKFQLAEGGTIFLDEIGEMPLHLQTKLLRVLQERYIERLGSNTSIPINVRVIAATNKKLEEMILTKEFREDLYYRLNVIPIRIPSLRERKEDIPFLLEYFLEINNKLLGKSIKGYTEDAMKTLINYDWRGNVRELQNLVEYVVNMAPSDYIRKEDIPARLLNNFRNSDASGNIDKNSEDAFDINENYKVESLDDIIKRNIIKALKYFGDDLAGKEMASKVLGISRATLYRKIKEYNIV
ncbi:sigma 54-interacting transcriptional regulator [Anaeromicrobium sediminis]|uniref:Sigma-54 factor interaction domain-containing protein n=1 Tax=Anaeromicrobium sediminis TaxID=1478221 RepID=A0A267MCG2_9FIRM|nr:sigma 54-interacting transcriptional regulator [Anaeromicrobium sediminis]PAB57147.1 hypothetical protein CCE28_19650 [Anaeromicrobium sediminis]